jgi:hypothetical protein
VLLKVKKVGQCNSCNLKIIKSYRVTSLGEKGMDSAKVAGCMTIKGER